MPQETLPKKINVECKTADCIPWREIKPLQGNYKKRSSDDIDKLCNLIIKRGIRFPSFVAKIGKDIWAIDTHGRLLAYEELEKRGCAIPPVPVVFVTAKTKAEAKQLLLECDSRYGNVTKQGYEEFVDDFEVETEYLSLEISLEDPEVIELESDINNETMEKIRVCPKCGFEFA